MRLKNYDWSSLPLIRKWRCIQCNEIHYEWPHWMRFECRNCGEYNWKKADEMDYIATYDDDYGM